MASRNERGNNPFFKENYRPEPLFYYQTFRPPILVSAGAEKISPPRRGVY